MLLRAPTGFIEPCLPSSAEHPPTGLSGCTRSNTTATGLWPGGTGGHPADPRRDDWTTRCPTTTFCEAQELRFVSPFIDGSGRARHNRLGMPRSRIEIYWKKSETAPEGVIAQVRVTDGAVPIICCHIRASSRRTDGSMLPQVSCWLYAPPIGSFMSRPFRGKSQGSVARN